MLPTNLPPADPNRSEGNVDQIRDILFGGQMREYDHRFALLERQIAADSERLRLEIEERFRTLAGQSAAALREVGEQLQTERAARAADAEALQAMRTTAESLTRQATEMTERYETRLRDQEARLGQQEAQLREQENKLREQETQSREHAAQHQAAHETARREHEALAARIEEQLRQLTASSAERDAISDLFTEMAGRLRRPPQSPSA